jgi:riboflavin biosynthesis pyrimidine reductase
VVASLRADGYQSVLSEGGPHLFGDLVAAGLVDELFLTLSPVLSGRSDKHFGLIEGVQLLPKVRAAAELLSARRHGSHLFLRYGLRRSG